MTDEESLYSRGILGKTMQKIRQKFQEGINYYEITITIGNKTDKKYGKIYYTTPDLQIRFFRERLLEQSFKRDINICGVIEFQANGNAHIHAAIKHTTGYEIHLRRFQRWCQKHIGNTRLSKIKNIDKYFKYIMKDYEPGRALVITHYEINYNSKITDYIIQEDKAKIHNELEHIKSINDSLDPLSVIIKNNHESGEAARMKQQHCCAMSDVSHDEE